LKTKHLKKEAEEVFKPVLIPKDLDSLKIRLKK
jgi:hypothetical protein